MQRARHTVKQKPHVVCQRTLLCFCIWDSIPLRATTYSISLRLLVPVYDVNIALSTFLSPALHQSTRTIPSRRCDRPRTLLVFSRDDRQQHPVFTLRLLFLPRDANRRDSTPHTCSMTAAVPVKPSCVFVRAYRSPLL